MEREIIFRGKTKDGKGWIEGSLVIPNQFLRGVWIMPKVTVAELNLGKEEGITDEDIMNAGMMIGNFFEVIPETVGQHISMEDKNKKGIFKGDEVKAFDGEIGIVDYDAGFCCWGLVNERRFRAFENIMIAYNEANPDVFSVNMGSLLEVIGTVHEKERE